MLSDDRLWFKNQYGFSKHRNVDLVLCRIIQFSKGVIASPDRKCILLNLDVEGAFDNINYVALVMALRSFLAMPLVVLLQNYLRNRLLYFNNRGTTLNAKQDRSVPQGSVPGLRLWNICVDRLSDLALPCSLLLLYTDDIFLLYDFQKRQQPTLTIDRDIVAINIFLERLGLCCKVNKSNLLSFGLVKCRVNKSFYDLVMLFLTESFINLQNIKRSSDRVLCACTKDFTIKHVIFDCDKVRPFLWQGIICNPTVSRNQISIFIWRLHLVVLAIDPVRPYDCAKFTRRLLSLLGS